MLNWIAANKSSKFLIPCLTRLIIIILLIIIIKLYSASISNDFRGARRTATVVLYS